MDNNQSSNYSNSSNSNPGFNIIKYPPDSRAVWYIAGVMAVITNSLLLFGITTARTIRNLTTIVIGSSFIIGILFGGVYILPRFAIEGYRKWGLFCSLLPMLGSSFLLNYNLHQCLICFDRLIAVNWPVIYRNRLNPFHYLVVIAFTWIFSLVTALIPMMSFRRLDLSKCIIYSSNTIAEEIFLYVLFLGCIFGPILIIVTCYTYIFYVIYSRKRKINQTNASISPAQFNIIKRKTMQASLQMAILALVFLTLMLPYLILFLILRLSPTERITLPMYYFAQFSRYIAFSYPAINPLLYAYFVESIRCAFFDRIKYLIYGRTETRSPVVSRYERASSMTIQRISLRLVRLPFHQ